MKLYFLMTFSISIVLVSNLQAKDPAVIVGNKTSGTLNILSTNTESLTGDAIAKYFTQLLYLQDINLRSSLAINERRISGNSREIVIETPLRVVSSHRFSSAGKSSLIESRTVARDFLTEAKRQGLLITKKEKE